jgi:arsenate reductase
MQGPYSILFLCAGNSARSIMAEAIMNSKRRPNFTAYSAGSHPAGRVNPHALKMIQTARLPIMGLRSKAWDEFAKPDALWSKKSCVGLKSKVSSSFRGFRRALD